MTDPVLSVVIPAFSVERWLDACLDSVLAASALPLEVILVDDGSTDATLAVARERASRDERLTVLTQSRRGPSAARNAGVRHAGGRYLAFVDADDVVPEGAHALLIRSLDGSGSDFALGAYVRLVDGEPGNVQPWVSGLHANPVRGASIETRPDALANVIFPSKVFRTSFWRGNGLAFPEGVLYEDQALSARAYGTARAFDVLSEVVYHWRLRPDRSSITQQERSLPTLVACLAAMTDAIDTLESLGHPAAAQVRLGQMLDNDLVRLALLAREGDAEYRSTLAARTALFAARATTAWTAVRPVQRERLRLVAADDWTGLTAHEDALLELPQQSVG